MYKEKKTYELFFCDPDGARRKIDVIPDYCKAVATARGYSTSFKSDVIIHEVSGNKNTGRMMLYSYASGQWWRPLNS